MGVSLNLKAIKAKTYDALTAAFYENLSIYSLSRIPQTRKIKRWKENKKMGKKYELKTM